MSTRCDSNLKNSSGTHERATHDRTRKQREEGILLFVAVTVAADVHEEHRIPQDKTLERVCLLWCAALTESATEHSSAVGLTDVREEGSRCVVVIKEQVRYQQEAQGQHAHSESREHAPDGGHPSVHSLSFVWLHMYQS
jgi:hypothetical protein